MNRDGLRGFANLRTRPIETRAARQSESRVGTCGHPLSKYNREDICFACQEAARRDALTRSYKRLTDEERKAARYAYGAGATPMELAERYGCSTKTMLAVVKGIKRGPAADETPSEPVAAEPEEVSDVPGATSEDPMTEDPRKGYCMRCGRAVWEWDPCDDEPDHSKPCGPACMDWRDERPEPKRPEPDRPRVTEIVIRNDYIPIDPALEALYRLACPSDDKQAARDLVTVAYELGRSRGALDVHNARLY